MDNDIEVQALVLDPIVVPPIAPLLENIEQYEFNINMFDEYQNLLNMGFDPVDETGDMTPTATYVEPMFVMDKKTIFYEFKQLQKGVGNQVLQEFLAKNGVVVLISKYHEIYVYQAK